MACAMGWPRSRRPRELRPDDVLVVGGSLHFGIRRKRVPDVVENRCQSILSVTTRRIVNQLNCHRVQVASYRLDVTYVVIISAVVRRHGPKINGNGPHAVIDRFPFGERHGLVVGR